MKEGTPPLPRSDKETRTGAASPMATELLEALLRRRALELARRQGDTEKASGGTPMMVFRLGGERYALELGVIKQTVPFRSCTRVPEAPNEVLGVMNVYGDIVPVIDVGRLLDIRRSEPTTDGYVLFLEEKSSWLGVRVDAVEGIVPITEVSSWREHEDGNERLRRCAKGMTADSIIVLDAAAILAVED